MVLSKNDVYLRLVAEAVANRGTPFSDTPK
jgi:hypothetical protein